MRPRCAKHAEQMYRRGPDEWACAFCEIEALRVEVDKMKKAQAERLLENSKWLRQQAVGS